MKFWKYMKNDVCWCKNVKLLKVLIYQLFRKKKISLVGKPPQKVKRNSGKVFFCKHGKLTWWSIQKENLYPLSDQGPLQHLRWSSFWQSNNVTNSSILDIAGDPRPTLAEYFSMAAFTLVPSAILPLHMVPIMKTKSEQCIKAEIQLKHLKLLVLKTILWRHYYSIKGLEKAILKDIIKYGAMA